MIWTWSVCPTYPDTSTQNVPFLYQSLSPVVNAPALTQPEPDADANEASAEYVAILLLPTFTSISKNGSAPGGCPGSHRTAPHCTFRKLPATRSPAPRTIDWDSRVAWLPPTTSLMRAM